jgi:hypothetical protein
LADSHVRRSAVVEKILKQPAPHHEPEVEEARDSFQNARVQSRESIMLDVKLGDGSIESFPYAWLSRAKYQPGDRLVLRFGKHEINIEGRNLTRLREIVTEHRARFIQEGTEGEEGLKPEDAAHIDRIVITEGDEEL